MGREEQEMVTHTLPEQLQTVLDRIGELPSDQQREFTERITDFLDDLLWDVQFADPRSQVRFDEMIHEAKHSEPWNPDEDCER
jgi:hypothetical protein